MANEDFCNVLKLTRLEKYRRLFSFAIALLSIVANVVKSRLFSTIVFWVFLYVACYLFLFISFVWFFLSLSLPISFFLFRSLTLSLSERQRQRFFPFFVVALSLTVSIFQKMFSRNAPRLFYSQKASHLLSKVSFSLEDFSPSFSQSSNCRVLCIFACVWKQLEVKCRLNVVYSLTIWWNLRPCFEHGIQNSAMEFFRS